MVFNERKFYFVSKYDIDSINRPNKTFNEKLLYQNWHQNLMLATERFFFSKNKPECANSLRPAYHNVNETIFEIIVYSNCPVAGHSHDFYAHSISRGL